MITDNCCAERNSLTIEKTQDIVDIRNRILNDLLYPVAHPIALRPGIYAQTATITPHWWYNCCCGKTDADL